MDIASFYSDLVFKRTYAKSFGETWEEAVKRYEEHFWQFVKPEVAKDYVTAIALFKSKDILGSMRGLASAGRALPYYPEAIYNCSYLIFDSWEAFADMFILLMLGVGVGYSVEKASIKLPPRPTKFREGNITIVVGDSKEGWRDAFLSLLYNLQGGMIPKFDYSLIRPAGAPLKTFGGTASGPEPLRFLFDKTIELFTTKPGKQWTPKEIFTLANLVANTVISGGVRRSACIALADYEDAFNLKYDGFWETEPWLAYSNVSIAIDNTTKVNVKDLVHHWKANNIGEPGIFNRKYAKDKQWVKLRRDLYDEQFLGTNPCLTKDALILTSEGERPIGELAKLESFDIVNKDGKITKGKAWFTGVKDVYQVYGEFSKPLLEATANHKVMTNTGEVVEVKDLKGKRLMPFIKEPIHDKDLLLMGFLQGDGTLTHLYNEKPKVIYNINHKKDKELISMIDAENLTYRQVWRSDIVPKMQEWGFSDKRLIDRELPEHMKKLLRKDTLDVEELKEIKGFLSGLFSANGSVISKYRVALKTSNKNLAHQVKNLLKLVGIDSYITTNKEHKKQFPNGVYTVHKSYDVNIRRFDSILQFANEINFIQKYKQKALRELVITRAPKVRKVVYKGKEEVYDFSEPETHFGVVNGFVIHNCGEIILRPFQFCNLTEVHVEPDDTKETLIVKAKMATLLGILQSLNTDYTAVLDPRWKQNAETEPLLGVSLTGLRNHPILSEHSFNTERILTDLRREVREYAKQVAEIYGLPEIKAITTVKPSGTASQILGTTPGLHNSFGRYVIRRLRINKNDPLVDYLKSFGFELFQDVYNNETLVVEFPLEYPNHRDRDVVEQIEYYLMMEWVWADHNPSTTITVKDDIEWEIVEDWLKQYLDKIVGITFLPDNNSFPQAPYEVIDKETYDSMVKKLRKASKKKAEFLIDSSVLESHSNTSAAFACSAGGDCETNVL